MNKKDLDLINLGKRVKKFRKMRNLTLESLAKATGISKGYLSKLENAQHEPSFSVLLKISRVLAIQISELYEEDTISTPYVITRVADRKKNVYNNGIREFTQWSLAHKVKYKRMEPQLLEIPFNDNEIYQFNDERFFFILEGRIKFNQGEILEVGDSIYITPNTPHSAISVGDVPAKVLAILCA